MIEFLHLSPIAPGIGVLVARRREFGLVAVAFFLSVVGEMFAPFGLDSWQASYYWLPLQVALVLGYLLKGPARVAALELLLIATCGSVLLSAPGPEWLVTIYGAAVITYFARGPLRASLVVYFGAGGLAYMCLIVALGTAWAPVAAWAYHGCRLTAYGLFVWACLRPRVDV